jgi:hypothetical protein
MFPGIASVSISWIHTFFRPCLDVIGFSSIHMCPNICGLMWIRLYLNKALGRRISLTCSSLYSCAPFFKYWTTGLSYSGSKVIGSYICACVKSWPLTLSWASFSAGTPTYKKKNVAGLEKIRTLSTGYVTIMPTNLIGHCTTNTNTIWRRDSTLTLQNTCCTGLLAKGSLTGSG